jgi:hypothetical protein
MGRTPPQEVLVKLRQEVNFGCPVPDCGIPYLTWHHFDPPWRIKEHHNPEGMIALCATHAALADGNRWTRDQLREMKQKPFVPPDRVSDFYGYLRRNVVCVIGNVAYNVRDVLDINGERVIGFERDAEGYDRLNLLIRDSKGLPVLVMENNMWTAYSSDLYDLTCTTQGKELRIVAKDGLTNLKMKFYDFPIEEFREYLVKGQHDTPLPEWLKPEMVSRLKESVKNTDHVDWFLNEIGKPETVPTWIITGKLSWADSSLVIRDFEIEDERRHNIFRMNFIVGGRAAFSFGRGSVAIGAA